MHRLFERRDQEVGIAVPSTAAFRSLARGAGPGLDTAPYRSLANRPLQLYVSPVYDPETGRATASANFLQIAFGTRPVGYKTLTLRHLWASAPYLHDGGVAVALRAGTPPAGADLKALLRRPDAYKLYGTASILLERERQPAGEPWGVGADGRAVRGRRRRDGRAPSRAGRALDPLVPVLMLA